MKKIILLLLICKYSLGQITLTPNSVGMNSPTENNVLIAQGNGLVVQKKYILTSENPNSNVFNLPCPTALNLSSLAGIIKDPNGDAPYIGGVSYNCNQTILPFPQPANILGYKLTFSILDLGVGDTLFIFSGETLKFTGNMPPEPVFLSQISSGAGVGFGIHFITNSDASVGQGFVMKYEAIFENTQGSSKINNSIGGNSLIFDTNKASLSAGVLQNQTERGIYSVGLGFYPSQIGQHSVSIGYKNLSLADNSTAIGSNNNSSGGFSVTLGSNNYSSSPNSFAIGKSNHVLQQYATAIGLSNTVTSTAEYGVGIGTSNIITGSRAIAFGHYLKSKSVDGVVLGNYNNEDDSPSSSFEGLNSTDRIFQIANGNPLSRSNALTILRNGNTGIGNASETLSPDSRLVIDGFTRLGTTAPKIKMKEISGNMPAINANNTYSHGLTDAKILSITITAEVNNQFIPPNYTGNSSLEYNYYWTAGSLYILNKNGNSAGLAGVPFKALITYKE